MRGTGVAPPSSKDEYPKTRAANFDQRVHAEHDEPFQHRGASVPRLWDYSKSRTLMQKMRLQCDMVTPTESVRHWVLQDTKSL